jgi:hypothetical protein
MLSTRLESDLLRFLIVSLCAGLTALRSVHVVFKLQNIINVRRVFEVKPRERCHSLQRCEQWCNECQQVIPPGADDGANQTAVNNLLHGVIAQIISAV